MKSGSGASALQSIIGEEAFRRVCDEMAGEQVYIPHAPLLHPDRDRHIRSDFRAMLQGGASCMSAYRHLANKYGLCQSRIIKIATR